MTQSELERLARIEARLDDIQEDLREMKDMQRCYTHEERIRSMGKSLAGIWASLSALVLLMAGAVIRYFIK